MKGIEKFIELVSIILFIQFIIHAEEIFRCVDTETMYGTISTGIFLFLFIIIRTCGIQVNLGFKLIQFLVTFIFYLEVIIIIYGMFKVNDYMTNAILFSMAIVMFIRIILPFFHIFRME